VPYTDEIRCYTSKHPWRFVLGNHDFNVAEDRKHSVPVNLRMPTRYYGFEKSD